MKDFFPLEQGTRCVYKYHSSEFDGPAVVLITVIKAGKAGPNVRMTTEVKGDCADSEYTIHKTAKAVISEDGIVFGGRTEFPLPAAVGKHWMESGDRSEIVSLSDKVSVKAGKFSGCMKVETKIEDSGTALRWYAPDVGLVREEYNGSNLRATVELVEFRPATVEEMKKPDRRRKSAIRRVKGE